MTFGDLKPGDKFLEWDVIDGFRKYLNDKGYVRVITKLNLHGTSGYVLKELSQTGDPCNAMASNGKLFSFADDYEVIPIR